MSYCEPRIRKIEKHPVCEHLYSSIKTCQHTSAYVSIRQHTSADVSIRQHTSAYVSIRQHTSAYVFGRSRSTASANTYILVSRHIYTVAWGQTYGSMRTHIGVYRTRIVVARHMYVSELRTPVVVAGYMHRLLHLYRLLHIYRLLLPATTSSRAHICVSSTRTQIW
jgi:hypothetical protein